MEYDAAEEAEPFPLYPIDLDLVGQLCVVVGCGAVAQRKVAHLLSTGARVRVICPDPGPLGEPTDRLAVIERAYQSADLEDARLVFAAATPEVNRIVAADARRRGIWVNVASDPDDSDFFVPAVLRRGPLVIAVSTGGGSPALARAIRQELEAQFDQAVGQWAEILAQLRPLVLRSIADRQLRRRVFHELCRLPWLERIRDDGPEAASAAMRAWIAQLAGDAADESTLEP